MTKSCDRWTRKESSRRGLLGSCFVVVLFLTLITAASRGNERQNDDASFSVAFNVRGSVADILCQSAERGDLIFDSAGCDLQAQDLDDNDSDEEAVAPHKIPLLSHTGDIRCVFRLDQEIEMLVERPQQAPICFQKIKSGVDSPTV